MKLKLLLALVFTTLMFTGCVPGQTDEEEMPPVAIMDEEVDLEEGDYLGGWLRTATYIDGILEHTVASDLNFYDDGTYDSATDVCSTSGTYSAEGTAMTMIMLESNCPGGVQTPFTLDYNYTIEENEDGEEIMTFIVANVMETYVRN
ncbi:hypothetical protein KJ742_05655 [Patescibacteria group bacterium]|nr:hypothetical protein [Patescibacteria group bacterium]MBU1683403.1 hypothetical protein [Patescibacteria group bacterium]MBU1934909.1 hypothetical protein [Patescibacteria group bacterium]